MKYIFWSFLAIGIYAYFMMTHDDVSSYTQKTYAFCQKQMEENKVQVHVNKWFNDTPKEKKEPVKKSHRRRRAHH